MLKKPSKIVNFSDAHDDDLETELCCVCLSKLNEEGKVTLVLPCMHEFHKGCIARWLDWYRKTCPICRFSMGDKEKSRREELTEEMVIWFSSFHAAGFWSFICFTRIWKTWQFSCGTISLQNHSHVVSSIELLYTTFLWHSAYTCPVSLNYLNEKCSSCALWLMLR